MPRSRLRPLRQLAGTVLFWGKSLAAIKTEMGLPLDMLTFYYDGDGLLHCDCVDDMSDDEDWCLDRGFV